MCVKREKGHNIKDKRPLIRGNGEFYCEDTNDKVCGDIICFPKNINCPTSQITFTS